MVLMRTCTHEGHACAPFPWGGHKGSCSSRVHPCRHQQWQNRVDFAAAAVPYVTVHEHTAGNIHSAHDGLHTDVLLLCLCKDIWLVFLGCWAHLFGHGCTCKCKPTAGRTNHGDM
jgi:hypothetical protein